MRGGLFTEKRLGLLIRYVLFGCVSAADVRPLAK